MFRKAFLPIPLAALALALSACGGGSSSTHASNTAPTAPSSPSAPSSPGAPSTPLSVQDAAATATPIKHLVVLFNENRSFDHYFGTYPVAANPAGEPRFVAGPASPTVNGLSGALLTSNPNLNPLNTSGAANPF